MSKNQTQGQQNDNTGTDDAAKADAEAKAKAEQEAKEKGDAEAKASKTVKMVRDEPAFKGGPVKADVHPDEVANMAKHGWVKAK